MVQSGDLIRPHFLTQNRFKKPIGIYWLQAASALLVGPRHRAAIWPYRLPSAMGALVAVLLTYWVGRHLFDRRAALLGAAVLAASGSLVAEAHLATTDAVLLACAVGAQGCLARLYIAACRGRPRAARYALGFWLAEGFGILVKGPIVPVVSGLTVAMLVGSDWRRGSPKSAVWLRALRWHWGIPLMLVVVLPWALAVGLTTHWAFYRTWIADILPKMLAGQESHGFPPGYYLVLLAVTFWPGSLGLGLGFAHAVRRRWRPAERFCLAWVVPTWIFFELMPTKLPHYVLPAYPAIALLVARGFLAGHSTLLRRTWVRIAVVLWGVLTAVMGIVVAAGAVAFSDEWNVGPICAAIVAAALGLLCVSLCWRGQAAYAAWTAVGGSVVFFALTLQSAVPKMRALWLSRAVSIAVAQQTSADHGSRPLAASGYQEPSLAFLVGGDVAFLDPTGAAMFLQRRSDGLVLVTNDTQAAFLDAANRIGLRPRALWSAQGVNYSKGRWLRLSLFDEGSGAVQPGGSTE